MTPLGAEWSVALLAVAFGVMGLVGVVKGVSGFGSGLLSVPIMIQLFDPTIALAALTLTLGVGNAVLLASEDWDWPVLARRRGMILAAAVGIVVGLAGITVVHPAVVRLIVGGYVLAFLGSRWIAVETGIARRPGAGVAAGGLGGLITGAFLAGGPVLVSYLRALDLDPDEFVLTLAFTYTAMTALRIATLVPAGMFGRRELALGVALLVPLSIGIRGGTRLRSRIPQDTFGTLVNLLLLAVAVNLLYDGAAALS